MAKHHLALHCRGLQQGAAAQEGTRSKLARVGNGLSVGGRMPDCNSGASAAQAVNLSDDDDDVVIIEEGMQPQAPHTHTASAKQPGELLCKLVERSTCNLIISSSLHRVVLQNTEKSAC